MTVGEMKKRLELYDDDMLVALADWQEGRISPSSSEAEKWSIHDNIAINNTHDTPDKRVYHVLVLGNDGSK